MAGVQVSTADLMLLMNHRSFASLWIVLNPINMNMYISVSSKNIRKPADQFESIGHFGTAACTIHLSAFEF